ncbi:MalY/PatB family protein [uncultured Cetobacterium sp.]|uniref:MalY/PatB family protein n=1 Tax=uncultured Cetobacterium sp. TaxID=527638 RepID=UPI00261941A1|nr:MalY/PatB family protein [uncultured Cetobacterium sp.]
MKNNFDKYVERRGTDSRKWNLTGMLEMAQYVDDESIPMWVADMDFKVPEFVVEKLEKRVKEQVFGYNIVGESYYESVKYWLKKKNNWSIEQEWIVPTSGVVPALCFSVRAFTEEGDGVIVQNPVYPPFRNSIELNNRKVINSSLKLVNDRYEMDFIDLERKFKDPKNKLFILCSPHNPVGRVWTEEELKKLVTLSIENNVIIVSDEIHSDLILFKNKFTSLGTLNLKNLIVCTSISKTFNLAALKASNIIISDESLREKFKEEMFKVGLKPVPNIFGAIATESCYTAEGEEWLENLKKYLENNYEYLKKYLEENIPSIKCTSLEGTYLAWLDLKGLNLTEEELVNKIEKEAKIVIDGGHIFGEEGKGFIRLNFACHRDVLKEALERLKKVF